MKRDEMEQIINNRLNEYTIHLSTHLSQDIQGAVKATVNGKIDKLTGDLKPMIEWFHEKIITKQVDERRLKNIIWWLGFISALSTAGAIVWAVLRYIVLQLIK